MIDFIATIVVGSGAIFYVRKSQWYKAMVLSIAKAIVKRID